MNSSRLDPVSSRLIPLCEFARKKENPSLKRYIAPPSFRYVLNPACGRPTNERKLLG
jgi:hypothetical protein